MLNRLTCRRRRPRELACKLVAPRLLNQAAHACHITTHAACHQRVRGAVLIPCAPLHYATTCSKTRKSTTRPLFVCSPDSLRTPALCHLCSKTRKPTTRPLFVCFSSKRVTRSCAARTARFRPTLTFPKSLRGETASFHKVCVVYHRIRTLGPFWSLPTSDTHCKRSHRPVIGTGTDASLMDCTLPVCACVCV